jgi:hypothetical protein
VTYQTEPIETLARIQEASFARASGSTSGAFPPERRMSGAQLESFLRSHHYAVLATVRADGRPHAAPIGFALVGVKFVFATLAEAARVQNLRHEPHASLVVSTGEEESHAVAIVEGTTRLMQPLEAPLEMRAPFRDAAGTLPAWIGLLIVLTPERILSYAAAGALS